MTSDEIARIEDLKSRKIWQEHSYMFTDFIPMLRAPGVSETDVTAILEDNPRRFFAGAVLPGNPAN
ncbi:hypothetical protein [Bradyrhizobium brasilense]|uniref:phosphotriesterase family protein n=1 Tax=Bradyrhizobium brasilense TaxID=1419277 RepID=UPI001E64DB2E|nr:hypothetical protein [Bradyrhizobium brasilense]MCC8968940.1 hypothetical protein [Bradyrhizobium brasilense]